MTFGTSCEDAFQPASPYLLFSGKIEEKVRFNHRLRSRMEERDVFVLEAGEIAVDNEQVDMHCDSLCHVPMLNLQLGLVMFGERGKPGTHVILKAVLGVWGIGTPC